MSNRSLSLDDGGGWVAVDGGRGWGGGEVREGIGDGDRDGGWGWAVVVVSAWLCVCLSQQGFTGSKLSPNFGCVCLSAEVHKK